MIWIIWPQSANRIFEKSPEMSPTFVPTCHFFCHWGARPHDRGRDQCGTGDESRSLAILVAAKAEMGWHGGCGIPVIPNLSWDFAPTLVTQIQLEHSQAGLVVRVCFLDRRTSPSSAIRARAQAVRLMAAVICGDSDADSDIAAAAAAAAPDDDDNSVDDNDDDYGDDVIDDGGDDDGDGDGDGDGEEEDDDNDDDDDDDELEKDEEDGDDGDDGDDGMVMMVMMLLLLMMMRMRMMMTTMIMLSLFIVQATETRFCFGFLERVRGCNAVNEHNPATLLQSQSYVST